MQPQLPDRLHTPTAPDLVRGDIEFTDFSVVGSDPYDFDTDNDGIGCET